MDHCCSQSTPSNYYTPKSRSATLQKCPSKCSVSTVYKSHDLEGSLKLYQQLLTQNIQLKNMLFNQNPQRTKSNIPHSNNQSAKTQNYNYPSNPNLTRHQSTKRLNSTTCNQSSYQEWSHESQKSYKQNDISMWSIRHRNNYLQQKLSTLQNQYQKQHNTITNIMSSQKWQNRLDCTKTTCYQDKYIKLLRVKSPVLLD